MIRGHIMASTLQDADRAAARGDLATAIRLIEIVLESQPASIDSWLKLAALRRAAGRPRLAIAAVDRALAIDPLHFIALLSRARMIEADGDRDEAARCYARALAQWPAGQTVPPALQASITHGEALVAQYRAEQRSRREAIAADVPGLTDDERRRVGRWTTNVLRETKVYHSEPTHYHYPGLVEREFHDRAAFPWLDRLEAATDAIRQEYVELAGGAAGHFEPYIQYDATMPTRQWTGLNHSLDWTAFHLVRGGRRIEENASRCPRTMAALAAIDQPVIAGRGPNAMFSVLKPHTHIPPHTGVANSRLVCHLPLIVPSDCWFRVGAERRGWREGEAFVFDDTIEHEAMNASDHVRIVLIVDCWHPGLSPAEREAIRRLMQAEEADGGAPL